MIKHALILLFTLLIKDSVYSQKRTIGIADISSWPSVSLLPDPMVSQNGKYVLYAIDNVPTDSRTTFIKELASKRELRIARTSSIFFSTDSKKVIYTIEDSLFILHLESKKTDTILHAGYDYRQIKRTQNEFLLYKKDETTLVVYNVLSGKRRTIADVAAYSVSENNRRLFLKSNKTKDNHSVSISISDIDSESCTKLWEGELDGDLAIDRDGNQFAFLKKGNRNTGASNEIYVCDVGRKTVRKVADDQSIYVADSLSIEHLIALNNGGKGILVKLSKPTKPVAAASNVSIWKTDDLYFPARKAEETVTACYNIGSKQFVKLQGPNEEIRLQVNQPNDTIAYLTILKGHPGESNWNPESKAQYFRVSTITGVREKSFEWIYGTPDGRFAIAYDGPTRDFISYDNLLRKTVNISLLAKRPALTKTENGQLVSELRVEAWIDNTTEVLLSDGFDIWRADLRGEKQPVNLTNGFGLSNQIEFHVAKEKVGFSPIPRSASNVLLNAFNRTNKESGFFNMQLNRVADPQKLSMGPYHYLPLIPDDGAETISGNTNQRRKWMIRRSTAARSYNVFLTEDFKTFEPVTDVAPERSYNWLTADLVKFDCLNGDSSKAMVFKPDNFQAGKKYPVIMYIYEKKSDNLNAYMRPELSDGGFNIPWFVSHGYVVCFPDISYVMGQPGESALNAVLGVVKKLKTYNWMDTVKIGLYGHSFGGYESSYIVSHSSIFTAAYVGAAPVDFISDFGTISKEGIPMAPLFEQGQLRIGSTPWDSQALYIKNSPLFYVNAIHTPILSMHNENDRSVPFGQGMEFFFALRRLGKKAWMLQYKNEGHTLSDHNNAIDFTLKLTDFFGFYLKGDKMPEWMEGDPSVAN